MTVRLKHVATLVRQVIDPSAWPEPKVPHYSIPNLDAGGPAIERTDEIGSAKLVVKRGDSLISKLNPHKPRVFEVEHSRGLASSEFIVLREPTVDPRFLRYYLLSGSAIDHLVARMRSVTRSHQRATEDDVANIRMTIVDRDTSTRIADFLDRETQRIDALVDAKRRMIDLLEEKRTATVAQLVERAAGPLGRVRHAVQGITSGSRGWAAFYADSGRPFIRIGNVSPPGIDLDVSDIVYVNPPPSKERTRTEAKSGDVVVSITADVGSVAVIDDLISLPCHVSQHIALLRPRAGVSPRYLAYALSASQAQAAFDAARYGGTKTQLALDDVLDIPVRIPPRADQDRIATQLDDLSTKTGHTVEAIKRQVALLAEYRQALITKAVTGQLDDATLKGKKPADEVVEV